MALAASGIHGRHTHDPVRTRNALEILVPTQDPDKAAEEINAFFESGWVGWDVKTAIEVTCGTIRGRLVTRPVPCLHVTREILLEHERNEERTYRRYTIMSFAALAPAALAGLLGAMSVMGARRRKRSAA